MPELENFLSRGNRLYNIETDPGFRTLFFRNEKLKYVDMSNNNLRIIPADMFSMNLLLEIIDLSVNTLSYIKINLSANEGLRELNLRHNRIKTLAPELMNSMENMFASKDTIFKLNLEENDLVCECDNIEFVAWMKTTPTDIENKNDLVCTDMDATKRRIIEIEIQGLEDRCSTGREPPLYVIVLLSLVSIGLVFAVFMVLCLRHHRICCFGTRVKAMKSPISGAHIHGTSNTILELEEISFSEPKDSFIVVPKGGSNVQKRSPKYAVFLAYCHEDSDFVVKKIHRCLEENLRTYLPDKDEDTLTLLYDKNFLPGEDLYDICKAAVINSYVTIAIISESFIRSNWCSSCYRS